MKYDTDQAQRRAWLVGLVRNSGSSKRQFAKMVDIDVASFTSMTTGGREISDRTVYRIVAKLKCAPPNGMPPTPDTPKQDDIDDMRLRLMQLNLRVQQLEKEIEGPSQSGRDQGPPSSQGPAKPVKTPARR